MTGRRLFGAETEYAVSAIGEGGVVFPADEVGGALMRAAERQLPHLLGSHEPGLFLANGSRVYLDAGSHPELAGPECLSPHDIVRYLRAGDRLLLRIVKAVQERNPAIKEMRLFANNVDYSGSGCTWGSHESYCHRVDPGLVRRELLPHLISRVIFTGAGGFNPLSAGLEFTLSPRAHHLDHEVSNESTRDRGIVHTRDEPLASHGYRRTHLICGENLRSDTGAWLRMGTTALVVAMIDGGVACGDEMQLMAPVDALRTVAADHTCSRRLRRKRGDAVTAIDIQRHYVAQAKAHLQAPFMPSWAGEVCERWSDMLDRLAEGPEGVSAMLDWAIKLNVYRDRASRRGFDWKALQLIEPESTSGSQRDDFLALRRELFEIDTRWGQLGDEGLFERLERAGVLVHHIPGVDRIDEAMAHPPAEGRAHARGLAVSRLATQRDHYTCGWDHVKECEGLRTMDLSDPFIETARWRERGPAKETVDELSVWAEFHRMLMRTRTTR